MAKKKVAIVGGTGYTGVELLRLLAGHPNVELSIITSRSEAGRSVSELFPNLRGRLDLCFSEPDTALLKRCDLIFFATPNGTAMQQVPALIAAGSRVACAQPRVSISVAAASAAINFVMIPPPRFLPTV